MADRFEQLKTKYQSVLNFIQSQGVQLQNLNMEGDKLLIRAPAPSADLKNRVWDRDQAGRSWLLRPHRGHPGAGGGGKLGGDI